jgi:hypothetical protein
MPRRAAEGANLLRIGGRSARGCSRRCAAAIALLPEICAPPAHRAAGAREDWKTDQGLSRRARCTSSCNPFFKDVPSACAGRIWWSAAPALARRRADRRRPPALMVPLPNSIDDHQMRQCPLARPQVAAGCCRESTVAARLGDSLTRSWRPRGSRGRAAPRARRRDAADRLADLVIDLLPQDARAALQGGTH